MNENELNYADSGQVTVPAPERHQTVTYVDSANIGNRYVNNEYQSAQPTVTPQSVEPQVQPTVAPQSVQPQVQPQVKPVVAPQPTVVSQGLQPAAAPQRV